jgi:hypothetical protein
MLKCAENEKSIEPSSLICTVGVLSVVLPPLAMGFVFELGFVAILSL